MAGKMPIFLALIALIFLALLGGAVGLVVGFVPGLVVAVASEARTGDAVMFWMMKAGILLGALIGLIQVISAMKEEADRKAKEESDRRAKEEYDRRAEKDRIQAHEDSKSILKIHLASLLSSSRATALRMPAFIAEAEKHLDLAEYEFEEGVFAPFWDQIENATNKLAAYHQGLARISHDANSYNSSMLQASLLLPTKVPSFTLANSKLPDARPTAERLVRIVRKAQKNFHFSTIYEQRKTNRLLYEGFRSLGDAIYDLKDSISSSLIDLSDRLNISVNELIDSQYHQTQVLLKHNEDMKGLAEDMSRQLDKANDIAARESNHRRGFEEKSLRTKKEHGDMLNNIQRDKKPLL